MSKTKKDKLAEEKAEKNMEETNASNASSKSVAKKVKKGKKKVRSVSYKEKLGKLDHSKMYNLTEGLEMILSMPKSKFDESVELHINLIEKIPTVSLTLPHGVGRETKVAIIDPTHDPKAASDLVKEMESGKINFDILIAHPAAMPLLAKVAKILGPRGLMPNPKNGTISPNTQDAAKKFSAGLLNFKTESKAAVMHTMVGKVSFGKDKLADNINALLSAMDKAKVKAVYLKSTMSPSVKINVK